MRVSNVKTAFSRQAILLFSSMALFTSGDDFYVKEEFNYAYV